MINNHSRCAIIYTIVQIVVLSLIMLMACTACAEIEEYRLTSLTDSQLLPDDIVGLIEDPDFIKGKSIFEMQYKKIYFAEGANVFFDSSMTFESDDNFVIVELPGLSLIPVKIDKKHLVESEKYIMRYEPPKMIIEYREEMLQSPYGTNQQIVTVLEPGEEVEVKARFGKFFFVYYKGKYGYIQQDGASFKNDGYTYSGKQDNNNGQYDSDLKYYEPYFKAADITLLNSFTEYIDKAMAIELATACIEKNIGIDALYQSDGNRLKTYVRLNSSHLNSPAGLTWQVIFYGNDEARFQRPTILLVDFDNLNDPIIVLPVDLEKKLSLPSTLPLMTEENWNSVKGVLGEDIQDRVVYQSVDVCVNTGDVMLLHSLLDTPYGRLSFYRSIKEN